MPEHSFMTVSRRMRLGVSLRLGALERIGNWPIFAEDPIWGFGSSGMGKL